MRSRRGLGNARWVSRGPCAPTVWIVHLRAVPLAVGRCCARRLYHGPARRSEGDDEKKEEFVSSVSEGDCTCANVSESHCAKTRCKAQDGIIIVGSLLVGRPAPNLIQPYPFTHYYRANVLSTCSGVGRSRKSYQSLQT
jgi:hypothetical protein